MPRYSVIKSLELEVEVIADSAKEAEERCANLNDMTFTVFDCSYKAVRLRDDGTIDPEFIEE